VTGQRYGDLVSTESDRPADRDLVLAAARLGWTLAELRGRLWHPPTAPPSEAKRGDNNLPLGQERTESEQLIEYGAVLDGLAALLGVNVPVERLTDHPKGLKGTAADWRRAAVGGVLRARKADPPDADAVTAALADATTFFYSWDAKIQDELAATPARSAAYQLARGVAEIRWHLDRHASGPTNRTSPEFLLGSKRGEVIDRLLDRLDSYYDPVTSHALRESLRQWRGFVPAPAAPAAPGATAPAVNDAWDNALWRQATIWHDLILGQREGAGLVSPRELLNRPGSILPIVRRLLPELAVMAVGAGLLLVAAALLASPDAQAPLAAVIAVLGVLGVTGAGISAKARASAMDLIATIRDELYQALVADKAVIRP
jgi:hypothetical protein